MNLCAVNHRRILVLGLGNDLIADDAVGILAARALRSQIGGNVDAVECCESGIRLLEYLMGYDCTVLIDAICTGKNPPGTITELSPSDLTSVSAPSPHYAGLPEIFILADQLEVKVSREIVILAVEAEDVFTIGGEMTPMVSEALPRVVERVLNIIETWNSDDQPVIAYQADFYSS